MNVTYQVVKAKNLDSLEKAVNAWLKHGWVLQGGIGYTHGGSPVQAIKLSRRIT